MLTGHHVALRAITPSDLEPLRLWRNQPEFRKFFREYRELGPDDQQRWYDGRVMDDLGTLMFAIEGMHDQRLLGACGLCFIDWISRTCDLSIYLGADDLYIDDVLAPDSARVLLRYAFGVLGMHRVWVEIYDYDEAKQRLLENLGFELDGRFREHHFHDGRWHDSLFYGLLDREFAG